MRWSIQNSTASSHPISIPWLLSVPGGELSGGGGKEAQTAFCSGGEWVGVGTKKQSQACGCGAVTFGKVFLGEFEHESLL